MKVGFRIRDEPFAEGTGVGRADGELRVAVGMFRRLDLLAAADARLLVPVAMHRGGGYCDAKAVLVEYVT